MSLELHEDHPPASRPNSLTVWFDRGRLTKYALDFFHGHAIVNSVK